VEVWSEEDGHGPWIQLSLWRDLALAKEKGTVVCMHVLYCTDTAPAPYYYTTAAVTAIIAQGVRGTVTVTFML
jgi:hypothetical protein